MHLPFPHSNVLASKGGHGQCEPQTAFAQRAAANMQEEASETLWSNCLHVALSEPLPVLLSLFKPALHLVAQVVHRGASCRINSTRLVASLAGNALRVSPVSLYRLDACLGRYLSQGRLAKGWATHQGLCWSDLELAGKQAKGFGQLSAALLPGSFQSPQGCSSCECAGLVVLLLQVQGGQVTCKKRSLIQGGIIVTSGGLAATPAPQIDPQTAQWHRKKGKS